MRTRAEAAAGPTQLGLPQDALAHGGTSRSPAASKMATRALASLLLLLGLQAAASQLTGGVAATWMCASSRVCRSLPVARPR